MEINLSARERLSYRKKVKEISNLLYAQSDHAELFFVLSSLLPIPCQYCLQNDTLFRNIEIPDTLDAALLQLKYLNNILISCCTDKASFSKITHPHGRCTPIFEALEGLHRCETVYD